MPQARFRQATSQPLNRSQSSVPHRSCCCSGRATSWKLEDEGAESDASELRTERLQAYVTLHMWVLDVREPLPASQDRGSVFCAASEPHKNPDCSGCVPSNIRYQGRCGCWPEIRPTWSVQRWLPLSMLDWRELHLERLELPEDLPEVRNGFRGRRVTHVESRVLDPCSMVPIELHVEVPQQLSSRQTCFGKR